MELTHGDKVFIRWDKNQKKVPGQVVVEGADVYVVFNGAFGGNKPMVMPEQYACAWQLTNSGKEFYCGSNEEIRIAYLGEVYISRDTCAENGDFLMGDTPITGERP